VVTSLQARLRRIKAAASGQASLLDNQVPQQSQISNLAGRDATIVNFMPKQQSAQYEKSKQAINQAASQLNW